MFVSVSGLCIFHLVLNVESLIFACCSRKVFYFKSTLFYLGKDCIFPKPRICCLVYNNQISHGLLVTAVNWRFMLHSTPNSLVTCKWDFVNCLGPVSKTIVLIKIVQRVPWPSLPVKTLRRQSFLWSGGRFFLDNDFASALILDLAISQNWRK